MKVPQQSLSSALLNELRATGDQALVAVTNEVHFRFPASAGDQAKEDAVHALRVSAARQDANAGERLLLLAALGGRFVAFRRGRRRRRHDDD